MNLTDFLQKLKLDMKVKYFIPVTVFNSWICDSLETSCCGHFGICKLAWSLRNLSYLVGSELEIYPSKEVRSSGAIVIGSIVAMFIAFTRLLRHLLN